MRIVLAVEYDGSHYHGWQFQTNTVSTVQQAVDIAISKVANHEIKTVCAGRTDTGVHASFQVVHFDTDSVRDTHAWVLGVNSNLPFDINILWAKEIENDSEKDKFHARFMAVERAYRYIVLNRTIKPAILNGKVTWWYKPLDVSRMSEASKCLIGKHDFNAYRSVKCQAHSPVREILSFDINQSGLFIYFDIHANAFLHHMIRNIMGVLLHIGDGRESVSWAAKVLESRDRTQGGITALPDGLYLTSVKYPAQYQIPEAIGLPFYG